MAQHKFDNRQAQPIHVYKNLKLKIITMLCLMDYPTQLIKHRVKVNITEKCHSDI
jgi:hypothetical protein